jgi:DNA-binding MarR family transcriptional regulator
MIAMSDDKVLPPALTGSVGFLMTKLSQRLIHASGKCLSDLKVHVRHVGVMMLVSARGPMSQRAIGDAIPIDRTTMVGVVDDLERLGYATRTADPTDRRAALVALTDRGREVEREASGIVQAVEGEFLKSLSPRQQRQFRDMLSTLFQGEIL